MLQVRSAKMLRTANFMGGSIAARMRMSSCASRIRHCVSLSVSGTTEMAENDKLNQILTGWPGSYRNELNNIIRGISLDEEYAAIAKSRYIILF